MLKLLLIVFVVFVSILSFGKNTASPARWPQLSQSETKEKSTIDPIYIEQASINQLAEQSEGDSEQLITGGQAHLQQLSHFKIHNHLIQSALKSAWIPFLTSSFLYEICVLRL